MKRSLVREIKRYQLISTSFFMMLSILLSSYLSWHLTYHAATDQLLVATRLLKHEFVKNQNLFEGDFSQADRFKRILGPSYQELIKDFPDGMTVGFYSQKLRRVVVNATKSTHAHQNGRRLSWEEPRRTTRYSSKPRFTLFWSKRRNEWFLECDNPVRVDDESIGGTYSTMPFYGFINLFWVLIVIIPTAITFSWGVTIISNRRLINGIKLNLNQLLLEDFDTRRNFDFIEFDAIYRKNYQAFINLKRSEKQKIKNQEEMERSNRKMENILESVSDAFFAVDQNLCYTYINKNAERLLNGGNRQSFVGKAATQVLPEYDSKTFIELLNHVYVENEPVRYETYSETKDNWLEVCVFPIEDGLAVFARDISNRKRLEKALLEERERYLITLGSIGDGVIATNGNGRIVLMNEAAEKITGYHAKGCVGQALKRAFYVIDDKTSEPFTGSLKKVLSSGATLYIDQAVLVTRDLMEVPVALSCAPIRNSVGKIIGAVIVFKDLSMRLKTEMELQKAQKLESLGILAGGIAHDFNNLLAAILLNTELALRLWQQGENIQKLLTQTISTTYKARNLSAQLLTFSKGGAPVKKTMRMNDLLKETISFVLRGSPINCTYAIADDLKPVEIDEGQMVQVLNNLIINAKQAMPKGGTITVIARNALKTPDSPRGSTTTEFIEIVIRDQGTGIPKEYLEKIYDPFFSTKPEGTGLGLATTYSIIKRHGGYIEVESQVNVGTTFSLYLPIALQIAEEKLARQETAVSSTKLSVLIMDDEDEIRNSVGEMLLSLGYDVSTAANGQEAIELYKKSMRNGQPFDVVMMDLTIAGGMGGQEAIAHLRDIDPQISAIVSSGYANDRVLSDYERFGFRGIVEKPYKIETLIETIHQVVNKK